MKAAVLSVPPGAITRALEIRDVPDPALTPGHCLLRVLACGVCRTDLHVVEGDLGPVRDRLIPGHQIVGEVVGGATDELPHGTRVGVSWLGGTDGHCRYCRSGHENLCDSPTFTGYTVDGGYAEYALARRDFVFPLPGALDDLQAAPLLCAGIIGFRSLRVAGVEAGDRVGLFGFGASAHLALPVLQSWHCEVFVSTRGASHRRLAVSLGATWVGDDKQRPPVPLDRAITFAPSGDVVVAALASLRKGRRGGDQCHSSGSHPRVRLRPPAVGRAADPERDEHDASGCAGVPSGRERDRSPALGDRLPARSRERGAPRDQGRCDRWRGRHRSVEQLIGP